MLLAVSLLVSIMQVLIKSVYPMQNVYFLKRYHHGQVSFDKRGDQDTVLVSFNETLTNINRDTRSG